MSDQPEITSRYADIEGVSVDPQSIPEKLRHLIPLAKEWAIGDDVERSEYMDRINETLHPQLQAFVDAVWPLLQPIQDWCQAQETKTPVPDEAVLFSMMCEACAEAGAMYVEPPESMT